MDCLNVNYDSSNFEKIRLDDGDARLLQSNPQDAAASQEQWSTCSRPSSSSSMLTDISTPNSTSSSSNIPLLVTSDGVNRNFKERVIPVSHTSDAVKCNLKERVISDPNSCPLCKKNPGRGNEYFLHMMQCLSRQSSNPRFSSSQHNRYSPTPISVSLMRSQVGLRREEMTQKRRFSFPHSSNRHPPIKRQRLQHGKHRPVYRPMYDTHYY